MTKGLENFLGMRSLEDAMREAGALDEQAPVPTDEEIEQRMQNALAMVDESRRRMAEAELHGHTAALDLLHDEVRKAARDLLDLGFNIEPARAARLMEVAAIFYDHAIKAKNSKRKAQMEQHKLALEERKLAILEKKLGTVATPQMEASNGTVIVEDRNALLKRLREQSKQDPPSV